MQYTVTTMASSSRVVLSVNDLSVFNATQSQYTELKELGDINARYPSIARAYVGVLSRNIVLIPQRYSIMRSKAGCAATCLARVDSSAASTSGCAFEFTFVIGPDGNIQSIDRNVNGQFERGDKLTTRHADNVALLLSAWKAMTGAQVPALLFVYFVV